MDQRIIKALLQIKSNICFRTLLYPIFTAKSMLTAKHYAKSQDSSRLAEFESKFIGKECFIIGNGPSLTIQDLEKLEGKYTFAANALYTVFDKTTWRPYFYMCVDIAAIQMHGDKLVTLNVPFLFFDISGKKYIKKQIQGRKNVFFVFQHKRYKTRKWAFEQPSVSQNAAKKLSLGYTVTFASIQLAIYMGFQTIYLIGVDHNYARKIDSKGNVIEKKGVRSYSDIIVDTGLGIQYIDITTAAYQAAKKYADQHNIKILDATRNGQLEVFEKVNFEAVLSNTKKCNDP